MMMRMTKRYIRELANDMIKDGHDSEAVERVLNYSEQGLISKYESIMSLSKIIEDKRGEWMTRFSETDFIIEDVMDEDECYVSYYLWATDRLVQTADEIRITRFANQEKVKLQLGEDRGYKFYACEYSDGTISLWFDVFDESADDDYEDYQIDLTKAEEKIIKHAINSAKKIIEN